MTITYSADVSSSTFFGIHKMLLRWKGSIWKLILPELMCWIVVYFAISFTYRRGMTQDQQIIFEDMCTFFFNYSDYIPITFMLGFYVSALFGRWSTVIEHIGWIDSPAFLIASYIKGKSDEARMIRRNVLRYLVLLQALVFRNISATVKKRFPTMDHLVTAGIMTTKELKSFDSIQAQHMKYWTPIHWAFQLIRRAREKGMIESDIVYADVLEKIRIFRIGVVSLTILDWIPVPLVYTQVVNVAVRSYFILALFGRQYLIGDRDLPGKSPIDMYVPLMTILQFIFYMGWMKVAEVMLNPLGEDDDDFETNWIIDRNLQVGLKIVDECYDSGPDLEPDPFWKSTSPDLLYTPESASRVQNPLIGSCNDEDQQVDALLLPQPRKRRLMSTTTIPELLISARGGAGKFSAGGATNDGFEMGDEFAAGDDLELIVPVVNHNPERRTSFAHSKQSMAVHFNAFKRKFSTKATSKVNPTTTNHLPDQQTAEVHTRNTGSLPSLFCTRPHSIGITTNQTHQEGEPISPISQWSPIAISTPASPKMSYDMARSLQHSGNGVQKNSMGRVWQVEEMLPVIQEVRERLERKSNLSNAASSTSISAVDPTTNSNNSDAKIHHLSVEKSEATKEELKAPNRSIGKSKLTESTVSKPPESPYPQRKRHQQEQGKPLPTTREPLWKRRLESQSSGSSFTNSFDAPQK